MLLAYPSDAAGKARPTPQAQIVLSGAILVPHGVNPSAVDSYGTPSHAEENLGGFKSGQPVFRNIKDNDISESKAGKRLTPTLVRMLSVVQGMKMMLRTTSCKSVTGASSLVVLHCQYPSKKMRLKLCLRTGQW